jgi:ribosomal-protein-alanine N-acetyltransferase
MDQDRVLLDEVIQDENLLLRARQFDDNAFVFEASRYKGFNDGMPWSAPETLQETEPRYHSAITRWIEGQAFTFIVVEKKTNQRAGMIEIRKTEMERVWDIGYWTHPAKQNKGLMTNAVKLIIEFGFKRLGAEKIEAKYATWNLASEKVLEKNGMVKAGKIEKGFEKNGKWIAEYKMEVKKNK